MFKAAVIQFDITLGRVSLNEKKARALIEEAVANGASMVVLPELWNTGYDLENIANLAQDMRGSSVKLLQKLSRELGIFIIGGSIAEKKGDKIYNTSLVLNNLGEIIYKYRKVHLFPLGIREGEYLNSGDEWGIFDTPWGRIGLILCYDMRFPAFVQNLVLRGAEMIVVPAQWPALRENHWKVLACARAIENQVFVLTSNKVGKDKTGTYSGFSQIINPNGEVIADCGNEAGFAIAEIDFSENLKMSGKIPVFSDRRRILDEIDESNI